MVNKSSSSSTAKLQSAGSKPAKGGNQQDRDRDRKANGKDKDKDKKNFKALRHDPQGLGALAL